MSAHARGFTLIQILLVLVLLGIIATFAVFAYQKHIAQARLHQAQAALLENATFMTRFYVQNHRYAKSRDEWPALPISQTDSFCIKAQGNPRGKANAYTLKAVALDKNQEARVLRINQDNTVMLCENSESSCAENPYFAGGTTKDQNCRVLR